MQCRCAAALDAVEKATGGNGGKRGAVAAAWELLRELRRGGIFLVVLSMGVSCASCQHAPALAGDTNLEHQMLQALRQAGIVLDYRRVSVDPRTRKATVDVSATGLRTLEPLSRFSHVCYAELDCSENPVADLGPLRGLQIEELRLAGCAQIKDLRPLAGMQLRALVLDGTAVSDLSPLGGMPLVLLSLHGAGLVTDLSPLAGAMELDFLCIAGTGIGDLSPLARLQKLRILLYSPDGLANDVAVLTAMPNLALIGSDGTASLMPRHAWIRWLESRGARRQLDREIR